MYSCTVPFPSCVLPVYQNSGSLCVTKTSNMFIIPPNLSKYPLSITLIDTFSMKLLVLWEFLHKKIKIGFVSKNKKNLLNSFISGTDRMPPKLHFTVTTLPVSCYVQTFIFVKSTLQQQR